MAASERTLVKSDSSPRSVREAAQIWAAATARRDGLPAVPPYASKLAGIASALAVSGASLHLAHAGSAPVGFALVVPDVDALELRYLAVEPRAWGRGVASDLLAAVSAAADDSGLAYVDLWVLEDNERALGVYERSGWGRTPDRKSQLDTRRTEVRLQRPCSPAHP